MNDKLRRMLLAGLGGLAVAAPGAWLLGGGMAYGLLVWGLCLGVGIHLLLSNNAVPEGLPAFMDALSDDGQVHLERRCRKGTPVADAFNQFLERADQGVIDIARSASRLVPISRELADSYMMIHQKSEMQKDYGNAVAEAMAELEGMRTRVFGQNKDISSAVDEAVNSADASLETVQVTARSMAELAESTDRAASQIDVLGHVNTEILGIAQTITDIAESTNLLALNAAIEAARAGEHGRGFAVVADEVRRLSSQTQDATARIRQLADSVGTESERTVAQIRETRDCAESTRGQMEEARQQIEVIAAAVGRIKSLSDAITEAMQEQQQVASRAGGAVASLVELNHSVVVENGSHKVSESDLLKLAQTLQEKIGRFAVSESGWDESHRPRHGARSDEAPASPEAGQDPSADAPVQLF